MKLQNIESIEISKSVFPVMKELRNHLDEARFMENLQRAKANGYRLVGAFENGQCQGLMGYRILHDFVHGRHIYIDDLVVTASVRSQGVGAKLLSYAKKIAVDSQCKRLRLCTGTDNERGKRFYERNGWSLKAVVYKNQIDPS